MNIKRNTRGFLSIGLFLAIFLAVPLVWLGYQQFIREVENHVNVIDNDITKKQNNSSIIDNSTTTVTSITKTSPVRFLSELEKQKERLLAILKKAPYFDEHVEYLASSDSCVQGDLSQTAGSSSTKSLNLAPGIFISAPTVVFFDSAPNDYDVSDLHIYDENGNHTGPVTGISGAGISYEEHVRNVGVKKYPGIGYILHLKENFNGRIELVGKKNSGVNFEMRGDGNSCTIASVFIPTTKYSVATIPMTANGDFGPISYDIDGDGEKDLLISLIHPLLSSKQLELNAVMNAMQ